MFHFLLLFFAKNQFFLSTQLSFLLFHLLLKMKCNFSHVSERLSYHIYICSLNVGSICILHLVIFFPVHFPGKYISSILFFYLLLFFLLLFFLFLPTVRENIKWSIEWRTYCDMYSVTRIVILYIHLCTWKIESAAIPFMSVKCAHHIFRSEWKVALNSTKNDF